MNAKLAFFFVKYDDHDSLEILFLILLVSNGLHIIQNTEAM